LPSEPTTPLRHAGPPASFGGVPPLPMPHLSSFVSQTALRHARCPFTVVHVPEIGPSGGSGEPFGAFGMQAPAPSHHAAPPQSASLPHVGEQAPLTQYGPACVAPVQSLARVHLPQVPDPAQYGFAALVHGCVLATPSSDVHPTHVPDAVSQNGVAPPQAAWLVPEHCTQWFVTGLQAGVAPLQLPSVSQGSHFCVFGPEPTHTPARH
jgi:hypothetical protein